MWKIPVYKAEFDAGIAQLIQDKSTITYASPLTLEKDEDYKAKLVEWCSAQNSPYFRVTATNKDQIDLYYLSSLLSSIGLNLNDDYFDKAEMWAARHTPEDKPFNYKHNQADIIGHMTSCYAIDDNSNRLKMDAMIDDLPDKYHIITGAVLYKYWENPDLQERMNSIIDDIQLGKWFVSMEAWHKGFDYMLIDAHMVGKVVARNENTAFLSKYLKFYGGPGMYNNMKLARVLRNITFGGVGLVDRPANPASVIFSKTVACKIKNTSDENFLGYNIITQDNMESTRMNELEQLKADNKKFSESLAKALESNEQLQKQLKQIDENAAQSKIKTLEADVTAKAEQIKQLESVVQTQNATVTQLKQDLTSANEKNADLARQLDEVKAAEQYNKRISVAMTELELDQAKAQAIVDNVKVLSDEAFASHINALKSVKTTAAAVPAAKPDATTTLEKAKPEGDAALATAGANVNSVLTDIASYFAKETK